MRARALALAACILAALAILAHDGHAQVAIDDRDIATDDGSTLQAHLGSIIDVNPSELLSVTGGLSEALARCPVAGRCILQLRCNATYTISPHTVGQDFIALDAGSRDDVTVQGCGHSSIITMTDSTGTDAHVVWLIGVNDVVGWRLRDFRIEKHETCASGCSVAAEPSIIHIGGSAEDIDVRGLTIVAQENATSDATMTGIRGIWINLNATTTPDTIPENINIEQNTFNYSLRGIEIQGGHYVRVIGNHFEMTGRDLTDTTPSGSGMAILKYEGIGDQIVGNTFDLAADGALANSVINEGVVLSKDFGSTTPPGINHSADVTGNSFFHMRTTNIIGVEVNGYDGATINSNYFQTGQCANDSTISCYEDEECSGVGGVCNSAFSTGIKFTADGFQGSAHNKNNTVVGNTFEGFNDDGNHCPIHFDAADPNDPLENSDNLIAANSFWLADPTKAGICGNVAQTHLNHTFGNMVRGGPPTNAELRQVCWQATTMNIDLYAFKVPTGNGGSLVRFSCMEEGTVTTAPQYDVQICDTSGGACATATTATLTCSTTGANTTAFAGAAGKVFSGDQWIRLLHANAGVVTGVQLCIDWKAR